MKILSPYTVTALFLAAGATPAGAQRIFRSDVYLGANIASGAYQFSALSGPFNYTRQSLLPTYGYAARLYGKTRHLFLETGVQIRFAESTLSGAGTVPGLAFSRLEWTVRHQSAVVPLRVGWWAGIGARKESRIEPYAGLSVGRSSIAMVRLRSSLANSGGDTVSTQARETTDFSRVRFTATADAGATFIPSTKHPKFQIGAEVSFSLTPSVPATLEAVVRNETQGIQQRYEATFARQYVQAAVTVRYAFGKRWKRDVQGSAMPCIQKEQVIEE